VKEELLLLQLEFLELEAIKFAILFNISTLLLTLNIIYNIGIVGEILLAISSILSGIGYMSVEFKILKMVRNK